MKCIVFDLAGVVFARNKERCPESLMEFFSFINSGEPMPWFWDNYDRGTMTIDEVAAELGKMKGCNTAYTKKMMLSAIEYQEEVEPTKALIRDLKAAGYRLIVLSNMSCEYIAYLRRKEVYGYFDGEVISCETHTIKPEIEIYRTLLEEYALEASETMFIDDRKENVEAAATLGIIPFHFDRDDAATSCARLRELLLGAQSQTE